jgi:competence protein ComEC
MPFTVEIHIIDVGQGESTLIVVRDSGGKGASGASAADVSKEKANDSNVSKEKEEKRKEEEEKEEEEVFVKDSKTEEKNEEKTQGEGGGGIVQAVLIDAGKQHAGDQVVAYLLNVLGQRRLESIVVTHFDNDHVGGLKSVFQSSLVDAKTTLYERCSPERIPVNRDTTTYLEFVGLFPGTRVAPALDDVIFDCGGKGPTLTCVAVNGVVKTADAHQDLKKIGYGNPDENDLSIALALVFDQFVYFTGGDLGNAGNKDEPPEDHLGLHLAKLGGKHVCAFKCSHHGSGHGTSATFVERIRPRAAFISCGQDNTFGAEHHPAQPVINVLETGKEGGEDAAPKEGHTIQKYYLTNCGYPRYFVNMPHGEAWPGEGEAISGPFWEDPDKVSSFNPVRQDPFKNDKEMARKILQECLDEVDKLWGKEVETAPVIREDEGTQPAKKLKAAPWEEAHARVLALFDERPINRKSDFFKELDSAAQEEDLIDKTYSKYRITFPYRKALEGELKGRLKGDVEMVVNRTGYQEVGVNWDYKKAVVAGGSGISGHLVLWVDADGAANHRFLVHYLSREYSQQNEEPPMPRVAEHRCFADAENVAPKNVTAVVTVEAKKTDAKVEGTGTWKPLTEGKVKPVWSVTGYVNVGGGDCLFHAILHRLAPEEQVVLGIDAASDLYTKIAKLRDLTANEIQANVGNRYSGFGALPANAAVAIRKMGSWDHLGGDMAPMALASILARQVLVNRPDRVVPVLPRKDDHDPLTINYNGRDHYW